MPAPLFELEVAPSAAAGLLRLRLRQSARRLYGRALDGDAVGFHELVKERSAARMEAHPEERAGRTEAEVWEAYGERYAAAFEALNRSGEAGSRDRAAQAGRRGLAYMLHARAFGRLGSFASALVTGTRDPMLLRSVIADLEAVADRVPAGEDRWSLRTYLADALCAADRPDAALFLYGQAVAEAEAAEHWADVRWICGSWANALQMIGRFDSAEATYRRAVQAAEKAGSPRACLVAYELEALRIDVSQGAAESALPEIERRLEEVRGWWNRHLAGDAVPDAPDVESLGRILLGALDVAREANQALENWPACLSFLDESEATRRSLGQGEHELAINRLNRSAPLLQLGLFGEAQEVLEGCLRVVRDADDLARQGNALSGLADLWDERGDPSQAVALERQALAVKNRLPAVVDRAASHGNLAVYLARLRSVDEAARHLVAGAVYDLVTGRRHMLRMSMRNLARIMRMSNTAAPQLGELLERGEFAALRQTLVDGAVDVEALGAELDGLVAEVRSQLAAGG